jgi:DNA-binding IscR family transcriptional regulator
VHEVKCQVRPHWNAVNDAMRGALAGVSLASLSTPPKIEMAPGASEMAHAAGVMN